MAPKGQRIDGALLGRLRTSRGFTQAQMAERLGIHWVTQSNIENGKALCSLELIERICKETGSTRAELLGESDDDAEAASMAAGDPHTPMLEALYEALGTALGKVAA